MKFEDIMEIEIAPFDEVWLADFYDCALHCYVNEFYIFSLFLLQRFFEKFNAQYNTHISILDEKKIIITESIDKMEDYDSEILMECCVYNQEIFREFAGWGGFEIFCISSLDEILDCDINLNHRKKQKKIFAQKLRERAQEMISWKALVWKNFDEMLESAYFLEGGENFILRNKDLGYYHTICSKYEELIEIHLEKEKLAIDKVIKNMKYPLYMQNNHAEGYLGEYYYIYFDTGSNGEQYLGFDVFNFHWGIACFVFGKLIKDFKEKLMILKVEEEWRNNHGGESAS